MKKSTKLIAILLSVLTIFGVFSTATPVLAADIAESTTAVTETVEETTVPETSDETETTESTQPTESVSEETTSKQENSSEELRLPDVAESTDTDEEFGEPIEVNEHSKIYQTSETEFKTVYSEIPNTYKNAFGKEIEYDNTLVLEEKLIGNDYYTSKSSDIEVKLPSDAEKDFNVYFEYNNVKVEMIPLDGDYSKTAVKENAILYNNVFDGIDIQYTVNELGLKEDIILNKFVEKNSFSYELDISGAKAVFENGVLNLYKTNGDLGLTISAPIMTDASGSMSTNITLSYENDVLTITADAEWLASPERAYPIKIDPNFKIKADKIDLVTVTQNYGRYGDHAYGYVGFLTARNIGVDSDAVLGYNRMLLKINDDFSEIPSDAKINAATLRVYQYTTVDSSNSIGCFRINEDFNINTIEYTDAILLSKTIAGEKSILPSSTGFHNFDIRDTVNAWVKGLAPNYGLCLVATNIKKAVGAFFTPYSSSGTDGQIDFTPDKAPQIIIDWEIPNPVEKDYPLDNTTINLRTIIESNRDGKLHFHGIFADGIAQPDSTIEYKLNDSSLNQDGTTIASSSYKYPNSSSFDKYFPESATKYIDVLSNWQTDYPFTKPEFNTVYYYTATATKDGVTGNTAKSDEFLIYKIKQYDTLPQIARYYGVALDQIMFDNRAQDGLLVENNTIIVRNPTKNKNKPYNPEPLDDKMKSQIDGLLMGRGKHCEFGFEPINLNTGNFYMNQTDISISDLNGNFAIERTYNSKGAGYNSIFGRGWQFAYSESLSRTEDGSFVYSRGDGSAVHFTKQDDGSYACPDGYYLTFSKIKVGTKEGDFGGKKPETYDVFEYEIKDSSKTVKRFNSLGQLIKITDDKGFSTTLSYDDNYNLKTITSPSKISYVFDYTADGYVKSITLPDGNQLKYAYDSDNNLVSYTDGGNNTTTYAYDDKHQMTSWSDANGDVVNINVYDSEGRVTKQTDGNGKVTLLAYGENKTTTTDANGNVTVYHYDDNYRTTKVEYPDKTVEDSVYDESNNLVSKTARDGSKTLYAYDANGNVVKETRFDGAVSTFAYDSKNRLITSVDFNGATTKYTYENDNLTVVENSDGSKTLYEYDDLHRVTKEIDANGNVTKYEYNGAYLSATTNANGGVNKYYYNKLGKIVSIENPLGQVTRFVYDGAGRTIQQQSPDGAITKFEFDAAGNTKSITDANGNKISFEYDANGNVVKSTNPVGNVTSYTYDGLNNVLTEKDASGNVTSYTYDCFSNKTSFTDADKNKTTYTYDTAGNLIKSVDANGNVTTFEYDKRFNKVSKITDAEGGVQNFAYDTMGNLVTETAVNGTKKTYVYNKMNRLVKSTDETGLTTTYTYDNNGNLLKTEDSAGRVSSYVYDNMDNLTSYTAPNGAVTQHKYDLVGNRITTINANGGKTTYTYDAMGRVLTTKDPLGRVTKNEYDGMGNLLEFTTENEGTMTYEYDALDRAKKVTDVLGNFTSYTYDKNGNLSVLADVYGNKTQYEYNNRNLLTKVTDANGNSYSYTYDKNGNQTAVVAPDGSKTVMEYDGLNRLVKSTDAEGLVTTYEYNAKGQLTAERDNTGSVALYTYDDAGRVATITNALKQTLSYTYDKYNNVASIKDYDGNTTKYVYDNVGNILSSTDAEGKTTTFTYDLNKNLLTKKDYDSRLWSYTYDASDRLTSETNPLKQKTSYEYNFIDLIVKTTNANAVTTVNEYDLAGNLLSVTDGNGNKTSYTYDKLYRLVSSVEADGGKQTYTYDAVNNLLTYKDAMGNVTSYTYDVMNRTSKMVRPAGGEFTYKYDKHGNNISITDPYGNVTEYDYDLNNNQISQILPNGAEYTYTYDVLGRITKQITPEGLSRDYAYDTAGNVISETDQSGNVTKYTYDKMHRMLSSIDAKGETTTFTYDNRGNRTSSKTPLGSVTTYEYDVLDRISKSLDPVGRTEEYTYDAVGNVKSITKTGGRVYTYTHDNVGNLLSVTNPLNQTASYTYDSMNRKVTETNEAGNTQTYTYNYNGLLTSVTNLLGGISTFNYDSNGNLSSVQDAEKRKASYTYDKLDRLLTVTEGEILTAEYKYDSVGNLVSETNGNGKTTTYTYDLLGNMTSTTDPLGHVKKFTYNVNAQLESIVNPDNSTIKYDYDKLNQLIEKSYDDDDVQAMYGYDADGNRISMDDVAGTTDYDYDAAGRIIAVNLADGKSAIKYSYDEYGNLKELTYPDKTSVTYEYDTLDRLVKITDRDGKVTTYEYDATGNVVKVNRPNNTYTDITYDALGNVTSVKNMRKTTNIFKKVTLTEISSFSYTYDLSGLITSEKSSQDDKVIERVYTYDARAQLAGVAEKLSTDCGKTWEISKKEYTYDNAGNRIKEVATHGTTELYHIDFVYNDVNQLIERNQVVSKVTMTTKYTYDANGNLIKDKDCYHLVSKDYSYDNENRLEAVKVGGTLLMAALYDGNGDRIFTLNSYDAENYVTNGKGTAANVYSSLSSKDVYSYDRTMVKNELLIPNGITLKTAFEYELTGYINNINTEHTQVLMEFGSNGRWSNVYDYGINRNSGDIRSNQKLYYMYDGRGSVSNLTSNSGINMVYYEYGVFGETVSSADGIPNPYQYNAEYTDAATGLQYLRARYYDSEINRFLTKDTYLGEPNEPLTKNLYAYANNNPINLNDPSGHLFGLIMGIITVGVTIYSSYKAVKTHNQQSAQIRQSQSNYESNATVQTGKISGRSYAAPTSANQTGSFSYYNARDNKTVTFTSAADYFAYKKLCDELDALDKNLASQIVHNTLDAVGVIPGVGEVADALNGIVYLAEGDTKNAVNSLVSCVPVVGDAIGKGAKNAGKLLGLASDSVKYLDDVTELGQTIAKKGPEIAEVIVENSDETIEIIETAIKNSDETVELASNVTKYSDDVHEIAKRTNQDPAKVQSLLEEGYSFDSNGRWHRDNGQFASYDEVGIEAKSNKATNDLVDSATEDSIVEVKISRSKYPESAKHIEDAIANGQPEVLTINRNGTKSNRYQSLRGQEKVPGYDLDEYPPAIAMEGGSGASVRAINPSDNRGSGSSMGHQLRNFTNGTKFKYVIVD